MSEQPGFSIDTLGPCTIPSPLKLSSSPGDLIANHVDDAECIEFNIVRTHAAEAHENLLLERAGPRRMIRFDPAKVHAGIVTCGGLCPGLNNVIRAIVMCLWYRYGVRRISGIRFGYTGLLAESRLPTVELTPEIVDEIHLAGGTIIGSSRGQGNRTDELLDSVLSMGMNMLFVIGGDGTQRAALDIAEAAKAGAHRLAVVGVPKTIDNDFSYISKSFGFETAVDKAVEIVACAHTEAKGALNGISIVKVMGRESGFIAAHTALSANSVNFVLIPEVPFALEGGNGLLALLQNRIERKQHAVIVVAEGAGQNLLPATDARDASGNKKLADIGMFLRDEIAANFKKIKLAVTMRYIDPSYIIRSIPAGAGDSVYCMRLGNNAAHAAMAGKTGMVVGLVNDHFVHLPIKAVVQKRNKVDPESSLWRDVLDATGQPPIMR
ncbi:MAG: ATP-dependent 6-phosphofructokinase [Chitinispirillaceae bacterium]|jgi:6-phosphofructokinase 1|nr:ATP-dependent 6-phosphofructokinase [Chitinispirillaceae bacterium]